MNKIKKLMMLALPAIVVACSQSNKPAEEPVAPQLPVVTIMSYDENHLPIEKTTGIFIEPNKLITVNRLAQGAHSVEYMMVGDSAYRVDAQIVAYSKECDLAVIQTESQHESFPIDTTIAAEAIPVVELPTYASAGSPVVDLNGKILGLSDVDFVDGELKFSSVSLKGLADCKPFTAGSVRVVPPACLRLDSVVIVSDHNPCECKVGVRNYSHFFIEGIEGMILFYDKDNVMYDMMNYKKNKTFNPEKVTVCSILVGDERVHPGEFWNNSESIGYTKGVSKTGSRHEKVYQSSDWLHCAAQSLEFRFLDFSFIKPIAKEPAKETKK